MEAQNSMIHIETLSVFVYADFDPYESVKLLAETQLAVSSLNLSINVDVYLPGRKLIWRGWWRYDGCRSLKSVSAVATAQTSWCSGTSVFEGECRLTIIQCQSQRRVTGGIVSLTSVHCKCDNF